ncbi:hypothetical protein F0562_020180 [Nyssa sinensis]|uniref:Uncharacterized protein n=1 Tax=Nyssa sinensis TaxID=561372 RepID=A0A5J5BRY8_9ASTE|nr:hypothetical protein F0562_020180 [Nyssa sinensis]
MVGPSQQTPISRLSACSAEQSEPIDRECTAKSREENGEAIGTYGGVLQEEGRVEEASDADQPGSATPRLASASHSSPLASISSAKLLTTRSMLLRTRTRSLLLLLTLTEKTHPSSPPLR